mgnify:CR=1 FL=1
MKNEFITDGYDEDYHRLGDNDFGNKKYFDKHYANETQKTKYMLINRKHKKVKGK